MACWALSFVVVCKCGYILILNMSCAFTVWLTVSCYCLPVRTIDYCPFHSAVHWFSVWQGVNCITWCRRGINYVFEGDTYSLFNWVGSLGFQHVEKQLGESTRGPLRVENIVFVFRILEDAKNCAVRSSWN